MKLDNEQAWLVQEAVLKRALEVLLPKRRDYSGDEPFANFYSSEVLGVSAWRSALVRLLDKISRMRRLAEAGGVGAVVDESLVDTAADAVNYVCIALGLILEAMPDENARPLLDRLVSYARLTPWPDPFPSPPIERSSG